MMKRILSAGFAVFLLITFGFPGNSYGASEEKSSAGSVQISDAAGMLAISENPSGSYELIQDVDMANVEWTPLPFSGTFLGNGHALLNVRITQPGPDFAQTVDGLHRGYDTCFAALFSVTEKAQIQDLQLINVEIDVTTPENCFAAGIAGYGADSTIENCSVSGRINLRCGGRIQGISGIMGYGYGLAADTETDVTLVLVDENRAEKCEAFLGGILACGYADVSGCNIRLDGYSSIHGYVHNGGIIGMDHIHPRDKEHRGYVKDCTVDAAITFFEDNDDRRAYCKEYVGERLNEEAILSNNTTLRFEKTEVTDYETPLMPERCEKPDYRTEVTEPTCTDYGYTTYTCAGCGYSYRDDYTLPAHKPGEWKTTQQADYERAGEEQRFCTGCGILLDRREIPKRIASSSCELEPKSLTLAYPDTFQLTANVLPEDAFNREVTWSSSDTSVATVDKNGLLQAVSDGQAVITCQSGDGFSFSQCSVQITMNIFQKVKKAIFG